MTERLLFISGLSQSGTTLLLALFDGHPDLAVYPDEPRFLRLYMRRAAYQSGAHLLLDSLIGTANPLSMPSETPIKARKHMTQPAVAAADAEARLADLSDQVETAARQVRLRGVDQAMAAEQQTTFLQRYFSAVLKAPRQDAPDVSATMRLHLASAAKAMHGDADRSVLAFKDPFFDARDLQYLGGLLNETPGAISVFVKRSPLGRLNSMLDVQKGLGRGYRLHQNPIRFLQLARKNARDYAHYAKWRSALDRQIRYVEIAYEDLVVDTKGVMENLCEQIGIAYSDHLLKPTKLGASANPPSNRSAAAGEVSSKGVDKWRSGLSAAEKVIQRLFLRLYGVPAAG
jgi:hypothetical protein